MVRYECPTCGVVAQVDVAHQVALCKVCDGRFMIEPGARGPRAVARHVAPKKRERWRWWEVLLDIVSEIDF
jgi:hypothetical protein